MDCSALLPLLGGADFPDSFQDILFPASNQIDTVNVNVLIAVMEDIINEAEELFVVHLVLIDALDPNGVNLDVRTASLCRIGDNDRKLK